MRKIIMVLGFISILALWIYSTSGESNQAMGTQQFPSCVSSTILLPAILNDYVTYYVGQWETQDNDSYLQANGPIYPNTDYFGYPEDEKDYFSFRVQVAGEITLDLANNVGPDPQMQLFYRSPSDPLNPSIPYCNGASCQIKYTPPAGKTGWYYVYISVEYGIPNSINYTLTASYPTLPTPTPSLATTMPPIPTCLPTATSTPTPIPGGAPLCDYPELSGINYVAKFDGTKIVANSTLDMARTNPVTITIPPGNYQVILSSYDDHLARTPQPDQTAESWFLILYNSQGEIIATTEPIPDLPDNQDCFIGVVNENLAINDTVFSVVGFHSEYPPYPTPPPSNPNSVAPAYAVLGEITGYSLMATPPLLAVTADLPASATPTPTR